MLISKYDTENQTEVIDQWNHPQSVSYHLLQYTEISKSEISWCWRKNMLGTFCDADNIFHRVKLHFYPELKQDARRILCSISFYSCELSLFAKNILKKHHMIMDVLIAIEVISLDNSRWRITTKHTLLKRQLVCKNNLFEIATYFSPSP